MGLGGSPSSINGSDTGSQILSSVVDKPLTGEQLIVCARAVFVRIRESRSNLIRMIECDELEGMTKEAVVEADRRYRRIPDSPMTRRNWVISKGIFLVMDMARDEARHVVCLSAGEFRGSVVDEDGERIQPRQRTSLDKPNHDDDEKANPGWYLKATSPPVWLDIHNRHLLERLDRALDQLPDQRGAIAFRLTVYHDWTQEEVAELFGVTASRVSQILTRSRKRLQVQFVDLSAERRAA